MSSKLSCCLVTFLLLLHRIHGQTKCSPPKGRPGCVCQTDKGLIDLTSIANTDGTPRYATVYLCSMQNDSHEVLAMNDYLAFLVLYNAHLPTATNLCVYPPLVDTQIYLILMATNIPSTPVIRSA